MHPEPCTLEVLPPAEQLELALSWSNFTVKGACRCGRSASVALALGGSFSQSFSTSEGLQLFPEGNFLFGQQETDACYKMLQVGNGRMWAHS